MALPLLVVLLAPTVPPLEEPPLLGPLDVPLPVEEPPLPALPLAPDEPAALPDEAWDPTAELAEPLEAAEAAELEPTPADAPPLVEAVDDGEPEAPELDTTAEEDDASEPIEEKPPEPLDAPRLDAPVEVAEGPPVEATPLVVAPLVLVVGPVEVAEVKELEGEPPELELVR